MKVRQLEQALTSRTAIDQATGVVMAMLGCPPASAWSVLVDVSQRSNTEVRHLAEEILAAAWGGQVDEEIRPALGEALVRMRPDAARRR